MLKNSQRILMIISCMSSLNQKVSTKFDHHNEENKYTDVGYDFMHY